jgi:hypothetical protein
MILGFFIFFQLYESLAFLILTGFGAMVAGVTAGSLTGIIAIISFICVLDFLMISSIYALGKLCIVDLPSLIIGWTGGHGSSQGTPDLGTPGRHQGVDAFAGAVTGALLRGRGQGQVKQEKIETGKEKP